MDWDRKVSSIVRDTESSLAKVKERLSYAHTSESFPSVSNSVYQTPLSHGTAKSYLSNLSSSLNPYKPATAYGTYLGGEHVPVPPEISSPLPILEQSSSMMTLLHDKIDAQTKTIEILVQTVKKLEEERDQHYKQIKDLKDEIVELNSRVVEKGVDLQTERKIEQWKQEVMSQISTLQSQVHFSKNADNKSVANYNDHQVTNIVRDLHDLKRFISTECDGLRYNIENVKTRLGRLENDLSSTNSENKSLVQRQNYIDKSMQNFLDTQTTSHIAGSYRNTADVAHLKSSIQSIRGRLFAMESDIKRASSFRTSAPVLPNVTTDTRPKYPVTNTLHSLDLSDLELSGSVDLADVPTEDLSLSLKDEPHRHGLNGKMNSADLSFDELNNSQDDLDDIRTVDLEDVVTANSADFNLTDDDLENEPINDHELSIDELS